MHYSPEVSGGHRHCGWTKKSRATRLVTDGSLKKAAAQRDLKLKGLRDPVIIESIRPIRHGAATSRTSVPGTARKASPVPRMRREE